MKSRYLKVHIRAPATVANVGAAFDCISIAVDLWNDYELWACLDDFNSDDKEFDINFVNNPYYEVDPKMRSVNGNLFVRAFMHARNHLYRRTNIRRRKYNCIIYQNNHIPPISGLGSSSSACVAGVVAGIAYFEHLYPGVGLYTAGVDLSMEGIARLARDVDTCPDNICACVEGGLTTVFLEDTPVDDSYILHYFRYPMDDDTLRFVILIPRNTISTSKASTLLDAQSYRIDDVVFNLTRASCLPKIFAERRYRLLKEATKDRIHQRQLGDLYAGNGNIINVNAIFDDVVTRGACAACISGSGSSLLAITSAEKAEIVANAFRLAFESYAEKAGREIEEIRILKPINEGVQHDVSITY